MPKDYRTHIMQKFFLFLKQMRKIDTSILKKGILHYLHLSTKQTNEETEKKILVAYLTAVSPWPRVILELSFLTNGGQCLLSKNIRIALKGILWGNQLVCDFPQKPSWVSPIYSCISFLWVIKWLYIKTALGLFSRWMNLGKEGEDAFLAGLQSISQHESRTQMVPPHLCTYMLFFLPGKYSSHSLKSSITGRIPTCYLLLTPIIPSSRRPFLVPIQPHESGCFFRDCQNTTYVSLIHYVTHSCVYVYLLHPKGNPWGEEHVLVISLYQAPSTAEWTSCSSSFFPLKISITGETSTHTNYWTSKC